MDRRIMYYNLYFRINGVSTPELFELCREIGINKPDFFMGYWCFPNVIEGYDDAIKLELSRKGAEVLDMKMFPLENILETLNINP